jgi:multiple sugar transport system substrate-binding protein
MSEVRRAGATRRALLAAGSAGGLLAAACGPAGPSGDSGAGKAADLKPATIAFWHWGGIGSTVNNYHPGFLDVAERFMKLQPAVKVQVDSPPSYWDKMVVALASDTPPDVFLINSVRNRDWAAHGTIREVSSYLSKDKAAANELKQVIKVFTDWYTVQGKLYGLPWNYSTIATVFNLAHLREANLQPPAQLGDRWDWNLATEYAQKLTKKASPMRWGFQANPSIETGWYNYVVADGGAMFDENRTRCTINSPAAQQATQFLVDLEQKSQWSPTRQELSDAGGVIKAMQNGVVSVTTNGDWNFKPLSDPTIPLEWDVSFIAKSPRTKKTASIANLRGLALTSGSKAPDQTFAFMAFTLRKEIHDLIPAVWQEVPARLDSALEIYADPQKAGPPANRKALADSIRNVTPYPAHDYAPITELSKAWDPVLNDIWDGKVAVNEGLRRMQEDVQKVLDQYRR